MRVISKLDPQFFPIIMRKTKYPFYLTLALLICSSNKQLFSLSTDTNQHTCSQHHWLNVLDKVFSKKMMVCGYCIFGYCIFSILIPHYIELLLLNPTWNSGGISTFMSNRHIFREANERERMRNTRHKSKIHPCLLMFDVWCVIASSVLLLRL